MPSKFILLAFKVSPALRSKLKRLAKAEARTSSSMLRRLIELAPEPVRDTVPAPASPEAP